jgi:hypothetical protein
MRRVGWFWLIHRLPGVEYGGSGGRDRGTDRGRGLSACVGGGDRVELCKIGATDCAGEARSSATSPCRKECGLEPSLLYTRQRAGSAVLAVALALFLLFFLGPTLETVFREPAPSKQSDSRTVIDRQVLQSGVRHFLKQVDHEVDEV